MRVINPILRTSGHQLVWLFGSRQEIVKDRVDGDFIVIHLA